jgi:uncharacterized protein (TIGR03437 family)
MIKTTLKLLVLLALGIPFAFGYTGETFTTTGTTPQTIQIGRGDSGKLQFYLNNLVVAGATSSLSGTTVISSGLNPATGLEAAMATWNSAANASNANINFTALQSTAVLHDSTDCKNVVSIAGSAADLSTLGFVSAASPGAVGVTVNAYFTSAGSVCGGTATVAAGGIADSDILLNPYFQFSNGGAGNTKDLQAVLTHEFGHVVGMNHSGILSATMYPYAATYARHLSADEQAYAAATYPVSGAAGSLAIVSGTITLSGAPVAYGLVTLIDQTKGKAFGTVTSAGGTYSFQVPAGSYIVYTEPFNGFVGPGNIYSLATGNLGGSPVTTAFEPTFLGSTASPAVINAVAGATATANISVNAGATTLGTVAYGVGAAGGKADVHTFNGGGAVSVTAGTSFDFVVSGAGIDSTISVLAFGQGISVTGSPRVDSGTITINGVSQPIIRFTVSTTASSSVNQGTLWIVKGTSILAFSGVLDIEPATPTVLNVLDAESARASITSGQYVAIYGNNLANTTRAWQAVPANLDFTGGTTAGSPLPTTLDGVSVTVNSVPAAIYSICSVCNPNQINIIAPSNLPSGPASVVVSNNQSASAVFAGTAVVQAAPSFFVYFAGSNYYPASVRFSDGKTVGDPAVLPGSEKALPGDLIIMFGNGLTAGPGGTIVSATAFTGQLTVTGASGSNSFTASAAAALLYAGEYQINVTLPQNVPPGNYTLTMTVAGSSTSSDGITVILPVGP